MKPQNILGLNYDKQYDVLYIKLKESLSSYEEEAFDGVSYFRDEFSDDLVGLTVWGLKKHQVAKKLNELNLPFSIDFEKDILPKIK